MAIVVLFVYVELIKELLLMHDDKAWARLKMCTQKYTEKID